MRFFPKLWPALAFALLVAVAFYFYAGRSGTGAGGGVVSAAPEETRASAVVPSLPNGADPAATASADADGAAAGAVATPTAPVATAPAALDAADGLAATPLAPRRRAAPAAASREDTPLPPRPDIAVLLEGVDLSDAAARESVVAQIGRLEAERRAAVLELAAERGLPVRETRADGTVIELADFEDGEPVYRRTLNLNAGISSGADILRAAPFSATGAGQIAGVWDAGSVRHTHTEFGNRVTRQNPEAAFDDHATHVAGTVVASGLQPEAIGMAPAARVDSYDWNDDYGEMTYAGAASASESAKLPVSNHSYGIVARDRDMGIYTRWARSADAVGHGLPFFLQFWAAGNDQRDLIRDGGYRSITHAALAKNIVTVGAVNDAVKNGARSPADGTMSDFSSWGPANDGRIKPDLVANGVRLFSPGSRTDTDYSSKSGTSMASPSAAGTALQLVQLYRREFAALPRAALLKALLIHTADDLGLPGPDYQYGWGLINGPAAAELINRQKANPGQPVFFEAALDGANRTWSYTFTWDGVSPLRATLSWMDPAGTAITAASDRNPNLVHNLDLAITAPDGTTRHEPFVMPYVGTWTVASMGEPATTGKNNTDNVEQVHVGVGDLGLGTYTLQVTADGPINPSQPFSLVLTGAGEPVNPGPLVNLVSPEDRRTFLPGDTVLLRATATDLTKERLPGVVARVEFLVDGEVIATRTAPPYEHSWVPPFGTYDLQARAVDSEGAEGFSRPVRIFVEYPLAGEVLPDFQPPSLNGFAYALAEDENRRVYIAGDFTLLDGAVPAARLARLNRDGSIDPDFLLAGGPDARVRTMVYSRGHRAVYIGGDFTTVRGQPRARLARLHLGQAGHVDGALDTSFAPVFASDASWRPPHVRTVAMLDNGKILVGGSFDTVDGFPSPNLVRLHSNGTVDTSFVVDAGGAVNAMAIQPDGKILVGGEFTQFHGESHGRLVRLHPADGSIDRTLVLGTGFNGSVHALAVALTGDIYVGGAFSKYRHWDHKHLARLYGHGAPVGSYNAAPGLSGSVNALHLRNTGELLAGGAFTSMANAYLELAATDFGRAMLLTPDGLPDDKFNPGGAGANGPVHDSLTLANGDILLAGGFTQFNGVARGRLAVVAGYDRTPPTPPVVTSRQFLRAAAGDFVEFDFTASGEGVLSYEVVDGVLPRGMRLDENTGRLRGVGLDPGRYEIKVRALLADGRQSDESTFFFDVEPGRVSYEQWKRAWFDESELGNPDISGPLSVIGSSGLPNLAVFALDGGDPRSVVPSIAPQAAIESHEGEDYLTMSVPKYVAGEAAHAVEFSTDLIQWTPAVMAEDSEALMKARAPVPAEGGRQFLRARLTDTANGGPDAPVAPPEPPASPGTAPIVPGSGSVEVFWNPAAGAGSYRLEIGGFANGPFTIVGDNIAGTEFTATNLAPGRYFFRLVAVNDLGASAASPAVEVLLQPAAPQGVTAEGLVDSIVVRWSPVAGVSSYTLHRGESAQGPFVDLATGIADVEYIDNDEALVAGRSYFYRVAGEFAGTTGPDSEAAAGMLAELPPPSRPPLYHNPLSQPESLEEDFTLTDLQGEPWIGPPPPFAIPAPGKPLQLVSPQGTSFPGAAYARALEDCGVAAGRSFEVMVDARVKLPAQDLPPDAVFSVGLVLNLPEASPDEGNWSVLAALARSGFGDSVQGPKNIAVSSAFNGGVFVKSSERTNYENGDHLLEEVTLRMVYDAASRTIHASFRPVDSDGDFETLQVYELEEYGLEITPADVAVFALGEHGGSFVLPEDSMTLSNFRVFAAPEILVSWLDGLIDAGRQQPVAFSGAPVDLILRVSNTGEAPINGLSAAVTSEGSFFEIIEQPPASLDAGQTGLFRVRAAQAGNGEVRLGWNGGQLEFPVAAAEAEDLDVLASFSLDDQNQLSDNFDYFGVGASGLVNDPDAAVGGRFKVQDGALSLTADAEFEGGGYFYRDRIFDLTRSFSIEVTARVAEMPGFPIERWAWLYAGMQLSRLVYDGNGNIDPVASNQTKVALKLARTGRGDTDLLAVNSKVTQGAEPAPQLLRENFSPRGLAEEWKNRQPVVTDLDLKMAYDKRTSLLSTYYREAGDPAAPFVYHSSFLVGGEETLGLVLIGAANYSPEAGPGDFVTIGPGQVTLRKLTIRRNAEAGP